MENTRSGRERIAERTRRTREIEPRNRITEGEAWVLGQADGAKTLVNETECVRSE